MIQLPEAAVNISNIVFSQNVTQTQTAGVLQINKALIAAQRGAEQQANTHEPEGIGAHFFSAHRKTKVSVFIQICGP